MDVALHPQPVGSEPTVVNCYDFFDHMASGLAIDFDLTEGIYHGDESIPYRQAQENQVNWLLDQVGCTRGSRILDIGCGNGRLLAAAQRRGAKAIGITISPPQVERCRRLGRDARLLNYRDIGEEWNGRFDGIVANGSIEHFVQPPDVLAGRMDEIYRELFAICHRLLDPESSARRLATTVIHQHQQSPMPAVEDLLKSPWAFRWKSSYFHFAMVLRGFGGYYPTLGQLARCGAPGFRLIEEVDGTEDYRITSDTAFGVLRRQLVRWPSALLLWPRLLTFVGRHPVQGTTLGVGLLISESWQWQFRGSLPPTRLLRQVWQCESPADGAAVGSCDAVVGPLT